VAGNGNIKLSTLYAPPPLLDNLKRKPSEKGNEYIKANHISINDAPCYNHYSYNSVSRDSNRDT